MNTRGIIAILILTGLVIGGGYLLYDNGMKSSVKNEVGAMASEKIENTYPDATDISRSFDISGGYGSCKVKGSFTALVSDGYSYINGVKSFNTSYKTVYFVLEYEKIDSSWILMNSEFTY